MDIGNVVNVHDVVTTKELEEKSPVTEPEKVVVKEKSEEKVAEREKVST